MMPLYVYVLVEAMVSVAPAAIRMGLRSEMGLAVMMFPPIACTNN
jgi:hypothetical protein